MPRYRVSVPFAGSVFASVEAADKDDAIAKVWNLDIRYEVKTEGEGIYAEIESFELLDKVASGNVCYAPLHRTEVELDENDEDEEEHFEDDEEDDEEDEE